MEVELRPTKWTTLSGEVSCTEVVGIEPGEQALTLRFLIPVVQCVRTLNIKSVCFPCGQWSYTSAVLHQLSKLTALALAC